MGTKETMVGAPLFVALWLWVCRPDMKLLGPPRALLAGLALTWVIPAWLFSAASRSLSVGFGLGGWTSWVYLRTQAEVIVHYLRLAFWPVPLVFHYAWLPVGSWMSVLPQVLLLGSLGIASAIALVKRRAIGLLGAWFFLILAPSSSIVPVVSEVAAEHRMYLPLAAVVLFVVLGVYVLARRFTGNGGAPATSAWSRAGWTVVFVVSLALAWQARDRNYAYANEETMTADIVTARPQNAQLQLAHAMNLIRAQKIAEAEPHLRMAISQPLPPQIDPIVTASMHMNLGLVLCTLGKYGECTEELKRAIAIEPKLDTAYSMLGDAQLSLRQPREALETFAREIALTPNAPRPLTRVAWILATSSDPSIRDGAKAIKNAEQAATLTQGGDVSALDALAAAYAEAGRYDEAVLVMRRAIALIAADPQNPFTAVLQNHLGLLQQRRPIRTSEW
jgi:tetratricopeptide (TPR) repeat protein